jgi:hypothetical protein
MKPPTMPGVFIPEQKPKLRGLGDVIERAMKPIASVLKMNCLDAEKKLKPESPCAKRREALNKAVPFG